MIVLSKLSDVGVGPSRVSELWPGQSAAGCASPSPLLRLQPKLWRNPLEASKMVFTIMNQRFNADTPPPPSRAAQQRTPPSQSRVAQPPRPPPSRAAQPRPPPSRAAQPRPRGPRQHPSRLEGGTAAPARARPRRGRRSRVSIDIYRGGGERTRE